MTLEVLHKLCLLNKHFMSLFKMLITYSVHELEAESKEIILVTKL